MSTPRKTFAHMTVTGIGEGVDLDRAAQLLHDHPRLEFGILLASHIAGTEPLYPSKDWICETTRAIPGNWALHVCWPMALGELVSRNLDRLVEPFGRIQINGKFPHPAQRKLIEAICLMYPRKQIITQYRTPNAETFATPVADNHIVLLDPSSGSGEEAHSWDVPAGHKKLAFAGGLSPDNLAERLSLMAHLASGAGLTSWGWDGQGKFRTTQDPWSKDGYLDLAKCERAIEITEAYLSA